VAFLGFHFINPEIYMVIIVLNVCVLVCKSLRIRASSISAIFIAITSSTIYRNEIGIGQFGQVLTATGRV
jgi:hypothetical protein